MVEADAYRQTEEGDEFRDTPERRLLVAVLAVAVNDANGRNRKHRERALAWIADESQARPCFTAFRFPDLCEHLGLSVEAVRRAVLEGTARRHIPLGGASGRNPMDE